MSIPFLPDFFLQCPSSSARSKLLGSSCYSLNSLHWLRIQQRINFKLSILVNCSFHNAGRPSILVIFTTSLYAIASASLCLPQSPLPISYQHYSCLLWFSTCWPFPLEFPPSSSQIYRLLHCLQIQSKYSPFLFCKHLWPLAIYIHALLIRHSHVDFSVLKLYYVLLCYISLLAVV